MPYVYKKLTQKKKEGGGGGGANTPFFRTMWCIILVSYFKQKNKLSPKIQ